MALNDGFVYREQLGSAAAGQTLVTYLAGRYTHSNRDDWWQRCARGEVRLNGERARGGELLRAGQLLEWHRPPWEEEDVPLSYDVIFEDGTLLAVSKPGGLPTMHGGGFLQHTLLHLVRQSYPEVIALHRLGRATSGLVLFARTAHVAASLSKSWREHHVRKRYRALAGGLAPADHYDIRVPIGPVPHPRLGTVYAASPAGKHAHSTALVLERREDSTLFQVDITTGRPHQIRIHLASVGHPLLGDPLYGPGGTLLSDLPGLPGDGGYWLHAEQLVFTHPVSGLEVTLRAPPPAQLQRTGK